MNFSLKSQTSDLFRTIAITVFFAAFVGITYGFSMDLFAMLIPDIMKEIKFTYVEAGGIASVARIGFLIASLVAGLVAPKLGAGRTIVASVFVSIVAQLGMGLSQSVLIIYVCAFVLGFCSSSVYVPMVAVVGKAIPFRHRAKVFGIISSGQSYANLIVGMSVPLILPTSGWRSTWFIFASVGVLIFALACLYLWQTGYIERRIGSVDEHQSSNTKTEFAAILNRKSLMIWLVIFFSGICTYPFQTFMSPFVRDELGLSIQLAGNMVTIVGFVGMWGGFLMGFVADRAGIRLAFAICYLALFVSALLLLFHFDNYSLLAGAGLFGLGYFSIYGLFPAYISKSFDVTATTAVFGVANVLLGLSTTIGSFLAGIAKSTFGTFGPVYMSIAGISAALILLSVLLEKEGTAANESTTQNNS
jgi:predicted MFS family arabinose efflux permease